MEACHSHVVEPLDPIAEKLCADRGLFCYRDIRSARACDHYSTMSPEHWLLPQQQADMRLRPIVKFAQPAFDRSGLGWIEPRHHHVDPSGSHPLPDFHDLLGAFSCPENNLGNIAA